MAWILKAHRFLKKVTVYCSPSLRSFDTFLAKIGRLFAPQSVFKVTSKIVFWPFSYKVYSPFFKRKFNRIFCSSWLTNFCFQGVKRSIMWYPLTICIKRIGNDGPSKIRLFSLMNYFDFMLIRRSVCLCHIPKISDIVVISAKFFSFLDVKKMTLSEVSYISPLFSVGSNFLGQLQSYQTSIGKTVERIFKKSQKRQLWWTENIWKLWTWYRDQCKSTINRSAISLK